MPNWCENSLTVTYKNYPTKKEIKRLEELKNAINNWSVLGNYQSGSLINIAENARIGNIESLKTINHRGEMISKPMIAYNNQLMFSFHSAWTPAMRMWIMIFDKYLGVGKYDIQYSAYEPGCQIYVTNNPEILGKYHVDIYDDRSYEEGEGPNLSYYKYCVCDEDVKNHIERIYNRVFKNAQEAIAYAETNDIERLYISVHEWEYVGVKELE